VHTPPISRWNRFEFARRHGSRKAVQGARSGGNPPPPIAKSVDSIYIEFEQSGSIPTECHVINALDIRSALVSELLAVSGILVLLTFVPGPKYMSDEKKSRRRFLSGSAAAPFIMTVHPGSVLAASSTSCFVNAGKQTTPVLFTESITGDSDIWLRSAVRLLTLKESGTALPGFYFEPLQGNTYWKFISNTEAPAVTTYVVKGVNLEITDTNTVKQALVLVDNTGKPVGFHWETGLGGSKITKSCYASFKP
jgi:hypothetical protein